MTVPHVLMTADAVGGVWRYALDLAGGLAERGVRTTLALAGPDPDAGQAAEAARVPGLELIAPGMELDWTADSPGKVETAGVMLAALAGAVRADVIHLNAPAYAAVSRLPVPVLGVAHSCVATWWRAVRKDAPYPEDFLWRADLTARGYRACGALAAPSRAFAAATAKAYGIPAPSTVHNGRRPPVRAAPPAGAPAGLFVFTAGRLWDEGKNLAVLDAAVAELDMPAFAAGALRAPHGQQADVSALQALGVLDETALAGWCAARPIFVSAALYEPFGLAVLEAAQAGCPLVLSDIPTFRELWNGAAVFVDPREPAALAGVLRKLAADRDWREALGAAARARSAAYTVEAMTEGVLALYGRLAPEVFAREEAAA